jgi:hypothetical protein
MCTIPWPSSLGVIVAPCVVAASLAAVRATRIDPATTLKQQ